MKLFKHTPRGQCLPGEVFNQIFFASQGCVRECAAKQPPQHAYRICKLRDCFAAPSPHSPGSQRHLKISTTKFREAFQLMDLPIHFLLFGIIRFAGCFFDQDRRAGGALFLFGVVDQHKIADLAGNDIRIGFDDLFFGVF